MTNIELVLNMLAKVTTKLIQKEPNLKLLDSFFIELVSNGITLIYLFLLNIKTNFKPIFIKNNTNFELFSRFVLFVFGAEGRSRTSWRR